MKKTLCVTACILLMIFMCSCKKDVTVSNQSVTDSQQMLSVESEISLPTTGEKTEIEPNTESEITQAPQEIPQTSSQSSLETPQIQQQTNPETEIKEEVSQISTTVNTELPPFNYTVNDTENLRGLSTEKKGFSFGIAKDGIPHSQSIINQQTFDSFENVQALALDTKTQEKIMYLTFDNGYEYKNLTADILDTLKEKNVKAAFFVTLSYAKQNPQLVRRMIDDGHIVGNHSTTHPSFPSLTRTQMAQEIATLDNYLRENFSYTSPYFRFPSGEHSECALELVTSIGFKSIFWSVAYGDWDTSAQKGSDYAFSTVTSRFHPGAVILLHAVSQDNADALGRIIDQAHNQGYAFKTLNEYTY